MTRLTIQWPDEAEEAIRAARGRLEVAGADLAEKSLEERLRSITQVVELWSAPDSPWRRELTERMANESSFQEGTINEGLESALRAWDPLHFAACARREFHEATGAGRLQLVPYACTSVLAGGSIPMPTLLSGLLPLVLGSPVLLRESSRDTTTGELLIRSIRQIDHAMGECVELARCEVEDAAAMNAFLASPCVVATGSDETISALRARVTPSQRFVGYGHRFSIAIIGPKITAPERARVAQGLALDIARWDQSGCLSLIDVYLVGLTKSASLGLTQETAEALEALSRSMPRGFHSAEALAAHATERSEARMRAASTPDGAFFEGSDFAVSLESDARSRPAPLARFAHFLPVASSAELSTVLAPLGPHLSNVCIAGFESTERIEGITTQMGVSRICSPGRLQAPPIDWPHDGMPLFVPLARFAQAK